MYGAHNSAIAGGHGHAVGATIATAAKQLRDAGAADEPCVANSIVSSATFR
ncbi:MAG: hypothetical protein ACXVHQ_35275 [Solirubrobacteraceae bacterium]